MTPEIIVCCEGHVYIYSSIQDAESYHEWYDVVEGGHEAFDVSGNSLYIYGYEDPIRRVRIAVPDTPIYKGLRLKILLRDFIESIKNVQLGHINALTFNYLLSEVIRLCGIESYN